MSHNSSQKGMKIYHPPLIPPIKGGKVPSPLVGEGLGEGYFRANTITGRLKTDVVYHNLYECQRILL